MTFPAFRTCCTKTRIRKKKYKDKTARLLSVLQPNQFVSLETEKGFDRKYVVTGIAKTPRCTFYSQVIKCRLSKSC